jgi:hypothetical protein
MGRGGKISFFLFLLDPDDDFLPDFLLFNFNLCCSTFLVATFVNVENGSISESTIFFIISEL